MIPGVELTDFITWAGVIGVALVVFAESGLLIGFFLPGDSLLFTAGFLTHQGVLDVNIHLFVLILFLAAAAGDSVGYAFGNRVGRKLFKKKSSLLFSQSNLLHAERFYQKHGSKTIVIARFIPIVQTFAPIIAGVGKMDYKTFLTFNLVGAFLWAVGITYIGYFTAAWLGSMIDIDHYLLPIIAVIILISILPPIIHILKDPRQRKRVRRIIFSKFKV